MRSFTISPEWKNTFEGGEELDAGICSASIANAVGEKAGMIFAHVDVESETYSDYLDTDLQVGFFFHTREEAKAACEKFIHDAMIGAGFLASAY